ncbi:MAG: hypothetical protein KF861_02090 [Planctomycetaceae bacterium]|nr:hypothetical protein [Planctomycetaceae bacterium]
MTRTFKAVRSPAQRAEAAATTDTPDVVAVAAAYEVALAATDGDKVAAAILAGTAVLAEQLRTSAEAIRWQMLTPDERYQEMLDG